MKNIAVSEKGKQNIQWLEKIREKKMSKKKKDNSEEPQGKNLHW